MAGCNEVGAEVARRAEEVDELHVLVASDAGNRGFALYIGRGERLDHFFAEPLLVIEDIVGNAEARGDVASVMNILSRAARALAMDRRAMVVELHRQPDDVVALALKQRGDDAGIDAARHRDDDASLGGAFSSPRLLAAPQGRDAREIASIPFS